MLAGRYRPAKCGSTAAFLFLLGKQPPARRRGHGLRALLPYAAIVLAWLRCVKRPVFFFSVIALIALVTLGGNYFLARALDARLPPLLSEQLGLPVQLAPITADILQLKARSATLVMGDPDDPAVRASNVEVTLALQALLRGEIRLQHAAATDLMLRLSRWPSSDQPAPSDYTFLDPWLPHDLQLAKGQLVNADGSAYAVNALAWRRASNGSASVQWWQNSGTVKVDLQAHLQSLPDLLKLAPIALDGSATVAGQPDSRIALKATVQPDKSAAYNITAQLQAAAMSAEVVATGTAPWSFPTQSDTTMALLEPEQLRDVLALYRPPADDQTNAAAATLLAAALPTLDLPVQRGQVSIATIRVGDETMTNTRFHFNTSAQGLQITDLSGEGAVGTISGTLGASSSDAQGWAVNTDLSLTPRAAQTSLAPAHQSSDWHWRSGHAKLQGQGKTWGALLYSLHGRVAVTGDHIGKKTTTPLALNAQLANRPGEFDLDQLTLAIGKGKLQGAAALSGKRWNQLKLNLHGDHLNLDFLFDEQDPQTAVGIALPEYLTLLPGMDMDVALQVSDLQAPGLDLTSAEATLQRSAAGGKFVTTLTGQHKGTLALTLSATTPPDKPANVKLDAQFKQLDLPAMFKQSGRLHSRASGTMEFTASGTGMRDIFSAMQGRSQLSVELRADNNWSRAATQTETLQFAGQSKLVLRDDRIVGLDIANLKIDSFQQDLTGTLSMVAGRTPWISAKLKSNMLDLDQLQALLPKPAEKTPDTDLLASLRGLGAAQITLNAKTITTNGMQLADVKVALASQPDKFSLQHFDFVTENGGLQSQATVSWKGKLAAFEGTATLADVDLDQFLIHNRAVPHVPVSGSAKLQSEGSNIGELLGNMSGHIDLQNSAAQSTADTAGRRNLQLQATRTADGMTAEITRLEWEETTLTGSLRYRRTVPPELDLKLDSGTLSLLPWENSYLDAEQKKEEDKKKKTDGNVIGSVAKSSAGFLGDVLLTPIRLFAGDDEADSQDKLFSATPLPLDTLKKFNMRIDVQLDALKSKAVSANAIAVNGSLKNGKLDLKVSSGDVGEGTAALTLAVDANSAPPTLDIRSDFNNVHGLDDRNTYSRSGYIALQSVGQSAAEIAANTNGLVFIELGEGPFDYANSALLTANLSTTVFSALIPGIERKTPELKCGIAVALFDQGVGVTPYGFAVRTNQANILGNIKVDLAKETLHASIDSRGRQGTGISVGSIFSNTIEISGPLNDPDIVPNATGLLWRGWAAVMTAGLSILGETVIKRILASENPCPPIEKHIVKDLCPKNALAAASEMLCPKS